MNLSRFTGLLRDCDTFYVYDDFYYDQTDLFWVDTITDSGTVAINDAAFGIATLTPSDGTVVDNDEVYFATANELFLFTAGQPLYGRCRLSFVETASGVYNAAFGFMNAVGANAIIDDGAGLKVSGSTVGIYKVDGETVWRCVTACNGTSTVSKSDQSSVMTTGVYSTLEIFGEDFSATQMQFTFKVNGVYLTDSTSHQIIRHRVTVASSTEMQCFVGAKLGASTNNDVTLADYVYAAQYRGQGA
jgi:hypothetical protein